MPSRDRWRSRILGEGIERLEASFYGRPYDRHRHDTYNIGMTVRGVQQFAYRGTQQISTAGEVFVLHPDELHDGRAGDEFGFGYRQVAIAPKCIAEAVEAISGGPSRLPYMHDAVSTSPVLRSAVAAAFQSEVDGMEPLIVDSIVLQLAEGLIRGDPSFSRSGQGTRYDRIAVGQARQFLDAERFRVVRSAELEAVTGLRRYQLSRQFPPRVRHQPLSLPDPAAARRGARCYPPGHRAGGGRRGNRVRRPSASHSNVQGGLRHDARPLRGT